MNYQLHYKRKYKSIEGITSAKLLCVLPTISSETIDKQPLRERLLQSDLMQLVLISDKGRRIIKTLRATPERADFYIAAIGQTFDIIIDENKSL